MEHAPGQPRPNESPINGRRKRIYERVMEDIAALIDAGELRLGGKLPPERAMAELFRVSRSAVREAIRALQEQGLLESRHGDGTYVIARPEANAADALGRAMTGRRLDLEHVLQFRMVLEPEIAALAAEGATEADLAVLAACLDARCSGTAAAEADIAFHTALAQATGNPLFSDIVAAVRERLAETREEPFQSPERCRASRRAHRAILQAVASRDGEAARHAMKDHLHGVSQLLFNPESPSPEPGAGPS